MSKPADTLLFLHLPKTAGSSLQYTLCRGYPAAETYSTAPDPRARIAEFVTLPEPQRHAYRLITGHQLFGLHRYAAPGARYVAMLRDPLARAVSDLNHRCREAGTTLTPDRLTAALLGGGEPALATRDNFYTRWLAAEPRMAEQHADHVEPDASAYRRACDNIDEHFAWLGVSERFAASVVLIADAIGRPLDRAPRLNAAPTPIGLGEDAPGSAEAVAAFRERNRWDQQLYDAALARTDLAMQDGSLKDRALVLERRGARVPAGRVMGYLRRHGLRQSARRALSVLKGWG